jgi:sugar transferase (PEP-CTERM system associated)
LLQGHDVIKVFNQWLPLGRLFQVVLEASFWIASVVVPVAALGRQSYAEIAELVPHAFVFAVVMMSFSALLGLYQPDSGSGGGKWVRLAAALFIAVPVALVTFTMQSGSANSREFFELPVLAAVAGFSVWRLALFRRPMVASLPTRRLLVLGTGAQAEAIEQCLTIARPEIRIVGFFPVRPDEEVRVARERIIADCKSVQDAVAQFGAEEIVIAVADSRGGGLPLPDLLGCKLAGVAVLDLASFFERNLGQVRLESLRASWLIFGDGFRQGVVRTVVKRLFDIVAASVLLIGAMPLMLVTAVCIAAESGFPILYRQERVGMGGRIFKVTKFRSMRTDAEKDGRPRWAASGDDRVTRIGRLIRRSRIDELPQLFSVLKGDMSLVGPRPERPYFVDQLTQSIPFYSARHSVKPGVTGWAQVRYQYGASVEDAAQKLQYDLFYVKNHSLLLDVSVLFRTVGVVLSGAGAH